MMDIIYELCTYIGSNREGRHVSDLIHNHGKEAVFDAAIALLAWLRRYGNGLEHPLQLKPESAVDRSICGVIGASELSAILEVTGHSIDFRRTIPTEERRKVAGFVVLNYRPEDHLMET